MKQAAERMNRTSVMLTATLDGAILSLAYAVAEEGWISLGLALAIGTALKIVLLLVLPDDTYRRLVKRLSGRGTTDDILPPPPLPPPSGPIAIIVFSILLPSMAEATDARTVLDCARTTTIAPVLGQPVDPICLREDETVWLDLSVGVDVLALQLTGKREVVSLGASPSLGLLIAWRPEGWKATPHVIGAELTLAMTLISPELAEGAATHVEIWTIAGVNLLGWFAIGIGGRYGLAVRDGLDDFARLVITSGLRVPI